MFPAFMGLTLTYVTSGCSPSLDVLCDGNETTPESDETEDEVEGAERVTSNSPALVNC